MNLAQLREPFAPNDIEWRVQSSGMSETKGPWAKVLAYVTNRAIMQRLDEVCGPENWQNEYKPWTTGAPGVMCGIGILINGVWVWKWDGAEQPKEKSEGQLVAVKGGFSMSMKRTAVQWGIGRYLYDLEEGWATISPEGTHYVPKNDKKQMPAFRWNPPRLPSWAVPAPLPEGRASEGAEARSQGQSASASATPASPAPARKRRDPFANSVARAKNTEVKGKPLSAYTTVDLRMMQDALRAEGNAKHKDLLADVVLVLNDRKDDDNPDATVARMHAAEDKQQAGLEAVMSG